MFAISLPLILSTFAVIFIAELPDKTALASLMLATKYNPKLVILGAWLAFIIQTLVAVFAGSLLNLLPKTPLHIAAGIGFLIFAFFALKRNEEEEVGEEKKTLKKVHASPLVASFLVVFAAEWGDLTQLATATLVARVGHPLSIAIGSILALWSVTVIAAVSGKQLSKYLSPKILNKVSGVLFAIIGLILIISSVLNPNA